MEVFERGAAICDVVATRFLVDLGELLDACILFFKKYFLAGLYSFI